MRVCDCLYVIVCLRVCLLAVLYSDPTNTDKYQQQARGQCVPRVCFLAIISFFPWNFKAAARNVYFSFRLSRKSFNSLSDTLVNGTARVTKNNMQRTKQNPHTHTRPLEVVSHVPTVIPGLFVMLAVLWHKAGKYTKTNSVTWLEVLCVITQRGCYFNPQPCLFSVSGTEKGERAAGVKQLIGSNTTSNT